MLTRLWRRLRAEILGAFGYCEFCAHDVEPRHDGCLYCADGRYCHACSRLFHFTSLYGFRY